MYHHKFNSAEVDSVSGDDIVAAVAPQPHGSMARLYAVLLVLGLPLILLWVLARFVWSDVKAVGRGISIFYRAAAEELSRS